MNDLKVDQLLQKIHDEGVLKAEKAASEVIHKAKLQAEMIIEDAESKAKKIRLSQEAESAKINNSLRESAELTLRDLSLKLENEIISKFKNILASRVESDFNTDGSQILKLILDANLGEIKEGVTIESLNCKLEGLKAFILAEFKNKIETIDFELSDKLGFRLKLKDKNLIIDYSSAAVTDSLMDYLGEDVKKILRDTKEA